MLTQPGLKRSQYRGIVGLSLCADAGNSYRCRDSQRKESIEWNHLRRRQFPGRWPYDIDSYR